jgi:uncharacterized membrane protein
MARIDASRAAPAAPAAPPSPPTYAQRFATAPPRPTAPPPPPRGAMLAERTDTRRLAALGFAVFPLAILALLDRGAQPAVHRAAKQALGFNAGWLVLWLMLSALGAIPYVGEPFLLFKSVLEPVVFILGIIYCARTWGGYDVRIPVITDIIDARLPAGP